MISSFHEWSVIEEPAETVSRCVHLLLLIALSWFDSSFIE